jgi:hypothetical protein
MPQLACSARKPHGLEHPGRNDFGTELGRSNAVSQDRLIAWMALAVLAEQTGAIGCSGEVEPIVASHGDGASSHPFDSGAPGLGASVPLVVYSDQTWNYDATLEGWQICELSPAGMLAGTILSWDSVVGNPSAGSARLEIPFTAANQQVRFGLRMAEPVNLTGKRLSVLLLLQSGLNVDPAQPGGAQVYAFSGSEWIWASGSWIVISEPGKWVGGELDIDDASSNYAGFDATEVREIGVMVQTGEVGEHTYAVVHVDTFAVSGA